MVPNWKKAEDYPPVKGTSLQRWAYEFLIRNKSFNEKIAIAQKESAENISGELVGWSSTPVGKVLKEYGVEYPMLDEWLKANISDSPLIFTTYPKSVGSYLVDKAGGLFSDGAIGKHYRISPDQDDKFLLEFDLTQPINPQIEKAKKMLIATQIARTGKEVKASASVKLFPWYLRVLDAIEAKVNKAKICEVLGGELKDAMSDDTFRNWQKSGETMRDGGYLNLVKKPISK